MECHVRRRRRWPGGVLALLVGLGLHGSAAGSAAGAAGCVQIDDVTAFAPRGEVYVRVAARCEDGDFEGEQSILAYLEVLVSDLPPIGQDIRVHRDEPRRRSTYVFSNLAIAHGDPLLVRLVRFDEIVSHVSVTVP
jgi:hypothetical protein